MFLLCSSQLSSPYNELTRAAKKKVLICDALLFELLQFDLISASFAIRLTLGCAVQLASAEASPVQRSSLGHPGKENKPAGRLTGVNKKNYAKEYSWEKGVTIKATNVTTGRRAVKQMSREIYTSRHASIFHGFLLHMLSRQRHKQMCPICCIENKVIDVFVPQKKAQTKQKQANGKTSGYNANYCI